MKLPYCLLTAITVGLLPGCSDPIAPNTGKPAIQVVPLVALWSVGSRNYEVVTLPAIRITSAASGAALGGRDVMFTMRTPAGETRTITRVTDFDGVARLPAWRLGDAVGSYTVVALTEGWGPVAFTVTVPGEVVAAYDLQTINGAPVPLRADWGKEGHYVFYESGYHNRFVNTPAQGFSHAEEVLGSYVRTGRGTIDLFMECWWIFPRCFPRQITATLHGTDMIVDDSEPGFPWIEVYALHKAP